MSKSKGFTESDLETKGFVKNEQGFYAKPSYDIKAETDTKYIQKVKQIVKHEKIEVPNSTYRGKKKLKLLPPKTNIITSEIDGLVSINVKPLSVNKVWQGKRFKTEEYNKYENILISNLPDIVVPKGNLEIFFQFGFSNPLSDWDNPVKPIQDVLQKRYNFNDKMIKRATVEIEDVAKGREYIVFKISSLK